MIVMMITMSIVLLMVAMMMTMSIALMAMALVIMILIMMMLMVLLMMMVMEEEDDDDDDDDGNGDTQQSGPESIQCTKLLYFPPLPPLAGDEPVEPGSEPGELGELRGRLLFLLETSKHYQAEHLLTHFQECKFGEIIFVVYRELGC